MAEARSQRNSQGLAGSVANQSAALLLCGFPEAAFVGLAFRMGWTTVQQNPPGFYICLMPRDDQALAGDVLVVLTELHPCEHCRAGEEKRASLVVSGVHFPGEGS